MSEVIKEAVRERDGFRCTSCCMTNAEHIERYGGQLDVHRLRPGSKYTVEGCTTLCRACHAPMPRRGKRDLDLTRRDGFQPVLLRVAPELKAALRRYAARERRTLTQAGALLLEKALIDEGLYTPPVLEEGET